MQSRLQPFIEAVINTAIGFIVALASQYAIFPFFGIKLPLSSHLSKALKEILNEAK